MDSIPRATSSIMFICFNKPSSIGNVWTNIVVVRWGMNEKAGCLFDYVGFDVVEFSCNDFSVCTWNENRWEFLVMRLMNYVHCASDIPVIIQIVVVHRRKWNVGNDVCNLVTELILRYSCFHKCWKLKYIVRCEADVVNDLWMCLMYISYCWGRNFAILTQEAKNR